MSCGRKIGNATTSEPPDGQKVIEKYLQGLRHDDGYSHGYLKSDEELKLFEGSLAAVNERYAVRTSRDLSKSSKSNVVFSRQSVHIWNGVLQENSGEKKRTEFKYH
ncbi:hypothetical protein MRX96_028994 [Rhipicephalus microplus]